MEAIWQWGIGLIISLQQFRGPALDTLFNFFTLLGDEEFYLLLLPLLVWSVDFAWGARVGFIFLFSAFINSILKDGFAHPRRSGGRWASGRAAHGCGSRPPSWRAWSACRGSTSACTSPRTSSPDGCSVARPWSCTGAARNGSNGGSAGWG